MPTDAGVLETSKALVTDFISTFYNDKDYDRARLLLTEDFTNHHPGVGVGRDKTIDGFREAIGSRFPGFTLTVRRIIAEGDHVWTHSVARVAPDAPPMVVVDIWRIKDGLLAEHWDVGQAVPEDSSLDELISDAK